MLTCNMKKKLLHIARDLIKTAQRLDKENITNRNRIKEVYKYLRSRDFLSARLNTESVNFFLSQLSLQKKKPKERRFTTEDKIFALSLLKQSPKAYNLLKKGVCSTILQDITETFVAGLL
ncbi:hypothetical protein AMK59_2822 [Oryctes borbonicus]|uniref:Uncharacterized protein n=1 Tax=Oryctes borbonicus TaxID=1629725 RepID=A0A0T6BD30_9SCAR|nr:hypothetical protein AMK59_2822 [Oryctes borbonicus]